MGQSVKSWISKIGNFLGWFIFKKITNSIDKDVQKERDKELKEEREKEDIHLLYSYYHEETGRVYEIKLVAGALRTVQEGYEHFPWAMLEERFEFTAEKINLLLSKPDYNVDDIRTYVYELTCTQL